ncbi:MAG: hypothetical protein ACXVQ6_08695 [Actinomycetota bacterium]
MSRRTISDWARAGKLDAIIRRAGTGGSARPRCARCWRLSASKRRCSLRRPFPRKHRSGVSRDTAPSPRRGSHRGASSSRSG